MQPDDAASRRDALRVLVGALAVPGGLLGSGCAGRRRRLRRYEEAEANAAALVERIRQRGVPYALQARFGIRVQGPDFSGTTSGAMILLDPDKLRIEIRSPVGPPLFILASDGKALNAWASKDSMYYRGDDALAVLKELTGGAVSTSDLIAMLTGGLPLEAAEIVDLGANPDGSTRVVFAPIENLQVRASLDSQHEVLSHVSLLLLDEEGNSRSVLEVDYADLMRVSGSRMPAEIVIEAPTIGWRATLEIHTWDELGKIPDAFDLQPPPGSTEADLVSTIKELAQQPAAHLPR